MAPPRWLGLETGPSACGSCGRLLMALSPVLPMKPKTEAAILPKMRSGSFGMILVDTELRIRTFSIRPVLHAPGKADSGGPKGKTCDVATVRSPPLAAVGKAHLLGRPTCPNVTRANRLCNRNRSVRTISEHDLQTPAPNAFNRRIRHQTPRPLLISAPHLQPIQPLTTIWTLSSHPGSNRVDTSAHDPSGPRLPALHPPASRP